MRRAVGDPDARLRACRKPARPKRSKVLWFKPDQTCRNPRPFLRAGRMSTGLRFRRCRNRCEDFAEQGKDFRDAEGLLQEGGFPSGRSFRPGIGQVAGHVDEGGLRRSGGGEDLRGGFAAVDKKAARGKMQVAEKNVVRGAPRAASRTLRLVTRAMSPVGRRLAIAGKASKERERFFDGGGTVHAEPLGREAFVQELAQAFFVVEDENTAALEDFKRGRGSVDGVPRGCRGNGRRAKRTGLGWSGGLLGKRGRKENGEGRTARGKRFGFDDPAMLANDGHADTESQARATARALGGVEGIKEARERFGANADTVILKRNAQAAAGAPGANLEAAGLANFADGLFRVGDQVEKNLDKLVSVAEDAGQVGIRAEIDIDIVAAQRVLVQLKGALDQIVDVEKLLLGRSGTRELQKVLDDACGAAGLAMGEIELALEGLIGRRALAQEFGDPQDGRERVIQLVCDAREHLAHGGKLFRLNELFFEALDVRDVAAGEDYAFDVA